MASHSSGNQQLRSGRDQSSGSSYGGGYKESSRVPLAAIAKKHPHMATLAEVMAPVVTTTSLLRTNGAADVIQIIANNLRMVREAIGRRPHLIAVVEPVTLLAIKTRGPAPIAPLGVTMIVMVPSAETMDPIRKTLKVPPLDVVIMTEVRLVLMGALGRLHMVGVVALGVANTITDHHLILAARGEILLPIVFSKEQTLSYGSAGRDEGVTSSSYGRAGRTEKGSSYRTSGRDQGTFSYRRPGRGEETSSYGRSGYDKDNSGSYGGNTGSYDNDNSTSSYGRSGHGEGTTTSTYGSSGRGHDNEESSYQSSGRSYDSHDNDTSEYGSSHRTGGDEGQSYDHRGGNRRGNEEESGGYGY